MTRLTRNSYKRKIILFGVFIFMSIALISTGFAAWVMSSDDAENNTGNVEVGVVEDSSVDVTIDNATEIEGFEFRFEPNTAEVGDLIHADDPAKLESLKLVITGKVTGSLRDVNIKMVMPAGVLDAINEKYIDSPVYTFYKTLEDCNNGQNGTVISTASAVEGYEDTLSFKTLVDGNGGNFVIAVSFAWSAEKFGGQNPCTTYNEAYKDAKDDYVAAKAAYETSLETDDYNTMVEKLEEMNEIKSNAQAALANIKLLRAHVYGYYDKIDVDGTIDELAALYTEAPKYLITITALAN